MGKGARPSAFACAAACALELNPGLRFAPSALRLIQVICRQRLIAWGFCMTDNGAAGGSGQTSAPFYRPYQSDTINHFYNLLFCDNGALFQRGADEPGPIAMVLAPEADRSALQRIADDSEAESRVRVLAFNRLRALAVPVPSKLLLGTIIEVPFAEGLDVLAVFADGRLRYINKIGSPVVFEAAPPAMAEKARAVMRASQAVVDRIGPATEPRRPPPAGDLARVSFLVSDGLYFGEASVDGMFHDELGGPVMGNAAELVAMLVDTALENRKPPAE
jgi:hypothetical protein